MSQHSDENEFILEEEGETGAAQLKKLREKLKACTEEKQQYLDGWQRARADFANLKKDETLRRGELRDAVAADFAEKLIPLVDSFEAAMQGSGWKNTDPAWREGIEGIYREFLKGLKELGVESFSPEGEPFNPTEHVAVGRTDDGETVVKVDRKGYRIGTKVLRPAYVTVGN